MNGIADRVAARFAKELTAEEDKAKRSQYRNYMIVRIEGLAKKSNVYAGPYTKLFKFLNRYSDQLFGDKFDSYWEHDHWFEGDDMILVVSDGDGKPVEPKDE